MVEERYDDNSTIYHKPKNNVFSSSVTCVIGSQPRCVSGEVQLTYRQIKQQGIKQL